MYTVEQIQERQMVKVNEIMDVFGFTIDQSISVLRYYKWNMDKLQNTWFDRQAELRKTIGIEFDQTIPRRYPYVNASLRANNRGMCQICWG